MVIALLLRDNRKFLEAIIDSKNGNLIPTNNIIDPKTLTCFGTDKILMSSYDVFIDHEAVDHKDYQEKCINLRNQFYSNVLSKAEKCGADYVLVSPATPKIIQDPCKTTIEGILTMYIK